MRIWLRARFWDGQARPPVLGGGTAQCLKSFGHRVHTADQVSEMPSKCAGSSGCWYARFQPLAWTVWGAQLLLVWSLVLPFMLGAQIHGELGASTPFAQEPPPSDPLHPRSWHCSRTTDPPFPIHRPGLMSPARISRGRLETVEYDSRTVGTCRRLQVYLPPRFPSEQPYPVLYFSTGSAVTKRNGSHWRVSR